MKDNFLKPFEWILQDRYRVFFHLVFWFVMYLDEGLSLIGVTEAYEDPWRIWVPLVIEAGMVYLNLYVLIPKFLLKGKLWPYLGFTFTSVLIVTMVEQPIYECGDDCWTLEDTIFGLLMPIFKLLGTAIAVKMFKIYLQSQNRLKDLENTNLKTELSYLKSQINPHFLFNALNNIYVLSRKRPAEAPEAVLLLSDLLRYQLYDCVQENVRLKDEIEYIKNYLKLDKLRKTNTRIDFDVKGEMNGKMLAPFLFLPFVENAVKHGLDPESDSYISIFFDIGEEEIYFKIINSKPKQALKKEVGGIGLTNVKRRLDLLYPEKHQLDIKDETERYIVDLYLKE